MRGHKARNFRNALAIDVSSLNDRFQQSYEFRLNVAYLVENGFDERCLLPSCKENLRPPKNRLSSPAGLSQKPDRLDHTSMPSTLCGPSLAVANYYSCHTARNSRIYTVLDQPWLVSTRRREFFHFQDQQTEHRNETDEPIQPFVRWLELLEDIGTLKMSYEMIVKGRNIRLH